MFQFASTAFTVTLNEVSPAWLLGVLVFPVDEPASALSPGSRVCSFVAVPAVTVRDELVLLVNPVAVAVTVQSFAARFSNTPVKVCAPPDKAAPEGSVVYDVDLFVERVTVAVLAARFQFVSTASTVTLNDVS